jgi:tetratricopeptide (TPR) repeat protein
MMLGRPFPASLLMSAALVALPAWAHGPGHPIRQEAPAAAQSTAAAKDFIPTHLLAAVCGMPGHHGDAAFQRRVQLVEAVRAQGGGQANPEGPPLYTWLGEFSYAITTDNEQAQRYFDQGLRLTYAFNHPEALRAFRKAQELDPACAMCYWGEAYALGPNINAPMDPAAVGPAVRAVETARERAGRAREHEQALIVALTQRYAAEAQMDRATLNQAYANAMAEVAARFPEDVAILSLYADALMNVAPWDYWEADGSTLKPPVKDLVPTLERALTKDPDHPYAIHLYIHAVEASTAPKRAEPYADDLAATIPGAGHIVHMPGHIYFRTGRFRDSTATNLAAVSADEYYLSVADPEGWYRYSYYPHNLHFLLESARMAGDGETALNAAEKLPRILSDAVAHALPWVEIIKAAPYFAQYPFTSPSDQAAIGRTRCGSPLRA